MDPVPPTTPVDTAVRAQRDRLVAAECFGTVFSEVEGFVDAIYPRLSDTVADAVLGNLYDGVVGKWKHWPEETTEANVFAWLERLQGEISRASNGLSSRVVLHGHLAPRNSTAPRRPDLAFIDQKSNFPCRDAHCCNSSTFGVKCPRPNLYWHHIRAVGELKKNPDDIGKTQATHTIAVTLMDRAREIFETQPTRRCVQCFNLGGDLLRCFTIDRAGIIGSKAFSIHREMRTALRVFSAFFTADIAWYGLDPTIYAEIGGEEHVFDCTAQYMDNANPFIKVPFQPVQNPKALLDRLYVDLKHPIFFRRTVISRGTLLCKARKSGQKQWGYVMKDMWRNSERQHEGDFLETVGSQPGICKYYHHLDVIVNGSAGTAAGIRGGLDLSNAVPVLPNDALPLPVNHFGTKPSSSASAEQLITYETHGGKRKRSQVRQTPKKRLKPDSTAARDKNDSPESDHELPKPYSRIHGRLIMQSVGRPLETFETATELLCAIRAALCGHRRLQSIGILHRDISINNILLPAEGDDGTGFLIDFDYAIDMKRRARSGAPHRTGTPIFMAIGVLGDEPASFFHDLHSFFYVLLWILTNHDVPGYNAVSDYTGDKLISSWTKGSYSQLRETKMNMLLYDQWQQYKQEALEKPGWQKRYQPMELLLEDWYDICFPEVEKLRPGLGRRNRNTFETRKVRVYKKEELGGVEKMYEEMIRALDDTIDELKGM